MNITELLDLFHEGADNILTAEAKQSILDGYQLKCDEVKLAEQAAYDRIAELNYKLKKDPNPFCEQCEEPYCMVSFDGTCAWIRRIEQESIELKEVKKENQRLKDKYICGKCILRYNCKPGATCD